MLWLYLLLISHFLNAIVFILTKNFVSGAIPNVRVYVFYESIGSIPYLLLIPFGVHWLPLPFMILTTGAGFIFSMALLFLYSAMKKHDISGVAPAVGAMTAVSTLLLSLIFLKSRFSTMDFWAFAFLVVGTLLVSNLRIDKYDGNKKSFYDYFPAVIASALFAVFYIIIKISYIKFGFISPFFWTRVGMMMGAGFILLFMNKDKVLFKAFKQSAGSLKLGFVGTKALSGIAFLLVAIAAYLGNVALVNAMQGLQYVFLIIISLFLIRMGSTVIKEKYSRHQWVHKIAAMVLVVTGLVLLGFGSH